MGENERSQEPQPQRRIRAGDVGVAQPHSVGVNAVAHAVEPDQMQKQKSHEPERHDPRLDRFERGAAALGDGGEDDQSAEQNQRGVAREQKQRRRSAGNDTRRAAAPA